MAEAGCYLRCASIGKLEMLTTLKSSSRGETKIEVSPSNRSSGSQLRKSQQYPLSKFVQRRKAIGQSIESGSRTCHNAHVFAAFLRRGSSALRQH